MGIPRREERNLVSIRTALIVIGLGIVAGALSVWTQLALYVLFLLCALGIPLLVSRKLGQPSVVQYIVLGAWLLRVSLFTVLKVYSYQSGLGGAYPWDADAKTYHELATMFYGAEDWLSLVKSYPPYITVVTWFYRFFGPDMNIPQIANIALSVLAVPLITELARRVSSTRTATLPALVWAAMPSGLLWSISLLKDIWVVMGATLSAFLLLSVTGSSRDRSSIVLGSLGVGVLGFIRPQYLFAVFLALGVSLVWGRLRSGSVFKVLLLLAVCLPLLALSPVGKAASDSLLAATSEVGIEHQNTVAVSAGSGVAFLTQFPPEIKWLFQLPFSVFAPFPWQWGLLGSGFGKLSGLEMLVWYVIYWITWKRRGLILASPSARVFLVYAFCFFLAVSFSLPNIGSMYRYRWPALVFLSISSLSVNLPFKQHFRKNLSNGPANG